MTNFLCLDCETSGLFDFKLPADHPSQPYLASISMIRVSADMEIEGEDRLYVKPDGWEMQPGATKVNGLTTEFLSANGVPVTDVLNLYTELVKSGRVLVAHNAQFDLKCARSALRRAGMYDLFEETPNLCTMRLLTDVCKIPPHGNRGGYKFPALSEALLFFGLDPKVSDHTASSDAYAVYLLLREMHKRGMDLTGAVHHAKDHAAIIAAGKVESPTHDRRDLGPPPRDSVRSVATDEDF